MARQWHSFRCSGRKSRWCPRHGTCTCTVLHPNGGRIWDAFGANDVCPLHGTFSQHPLPGRLITKEKPWLDAK